MCMKLITQIPSKDGYSAASLDSLLQGYRNSPLIRVGFFTHMPNQNLGSCDLKYFLSCPQWQGELPPSLKRYSYVYIHKNMCVYIYSGGCVYVCVYTHTSKRKIFIALIYMYICLYSVKYKHYIINGGTNYEV